jgi:hypothetical protein
MNNDELRKSAKFVLNHIGNNGILCVGAHSCDQCICNYMRHTIGSKLFCYETVPYIRKWLRENGDIQKEFDFDEI